MRKLKNTLNLHVKSSGTDECRIENVLQIGGRDDQNAFVVAETSDFVEELIDGLAAGSAAVKGTLETDGIDFVNEYNAGSLEEMSKWSGVGERRAFCIREEKVRC